MNLNAVIFLGLLGTSFAIGAIAARSVRNVSDYYVAGGRMPWYLLTGTFIASNASAGVFLGATNMAGKHGYAMWCAYFTTSIGFLLAIAVVGVLVRRLASHYEIYDFADILATRYSSRGGTIRLLTASFLPIVYIPALAAQFIALTTIAASMFGLPYHILLSGIVILVVGYTLLGGMLGVVWSDGFQFLVLFFGLVLAVPIGMFAIGDGDLTQGWVRILQLPHSQFRWSTEDWPWYLVMSQFVWLFAIPVQPHLVTRFLTARDERSIMIALPVCLTIGLLIYASTVPVGLLGRLTQPELAAGEYYYIELARQHLGPWLGAFALAGISAAALSTCSTILIVTGQSFSRELYQQWLARDATEQQSLRMARLGVLLVGMIGFAIAYFQLLGIFWLVVLSASLLASVYFVPMMAGLFSKAASANGAVAAMIAGGVTATLVFVLNEALDAHYFISEFFAGLGASALAMWLVSRYSSVTEAERDVLLSIRGG
ncbi:MAG: sodium:solute symporter family protein [Gammaproteobacteria bacterium]